METKKFRRKRKISFIICFSVIAIACYLLIMWIQLRSDLKEKQEKLKDVQAQYSQQYEENNTLREEISSGISDEEMERIARQEHGYVMPGENVYADGSAGK